MVATVSPRCRPCVGLLPNNPKLLLALYLLLAAVVTSSTYASGAEEVKKEKEGSSKTTLSNDDHFTNQVNWLTSPANNGYFSSKITYNNGAMYATEHVDKNELLMVIPSKVVFSASYDDNVDGKKSEKKKNSTTTTTTTNDNDKLCATVTKLANEYTKGPTSHYYPFLQYIFDPSHSGELPQSWSNEGKALLRKITSDELFGDDEYDVAGMEYEKVCGKYTTTNNKNKDQQQLELLAYQQVLRRSCGMMLWSQYWIC